MAASTGTGELENPEQNARDRGELREFLSQVIAERRARPRDDLISQIIAGGETGQSLTDPEAHSFSMLLLLAGIETTTNLLGNAIRALLAHPDSLRRVVADPSLIPGTLEETLRWDGPVQGLFRSPTQDVELSGVKIPQGSFVLLLNGSANRDAAQFPDAERFDIDRKTGGHLGFGFGVHFCLGASLARLEARVALETFFARCRQLEHAGDPDAVEVINSLLVRGPKTLPLAFEVAA